MPRPAQLFDWELLADERSEGGPVENTAMRLRWLLAGFVVAALVILGRALQLEVSDGENFRRLAAEPLARELPLAARRGSIVDRNGVVLAEDRMARGLAVEYRYLQQPPDPAWLRRLARARLPKSERRNLQRLEASEQRLREELAELHRRLAALCGLSERQWQWRVARIEGRVRSVANSVNARRLDDYYELMLAEDASSDITLLVLVRGLFAPPERLPPAPMLVAEERAHHLLVDHVTDEVALEISAHPEHWPGVKLIEHLRRHYPRGAVAANLLGHVSAQADQVSGAPGLMGIERRSNDHLAGHSGLETRKVDRRGMLVSSQRTREPVDGHSLELALDARLQQAAEAWLDRRTRTLSSDAASQRSAAAGGAIVVLDVEAGDILTAASSPRFDPNWFAGGDPRVESALADPRRPLFDRATKMAIAPGSVFKPLVALALVESQAVDPAEPFRCQGYFDEPDRLRCQIFRQHGIGHGDVTLADALAQSCNVYFFHHAPQLGGPALVEWARRFGFGAVTGADVDDEASGTLPADAAVRGAGAVQQLAIGQGTLTATPLQVARLYAAIASGGKLVTPRLLRETGDRGPNAERSVGETSSPDGLQPSAASLAAVRDGLERVVNDPHGTGYDTVRLAWPTIAGKTGTAETGGTSADHAWFAGYVPALAPRYAFVVALEHGGSGATAAGTIARQLVLEMRALGYFGKADEPAEAPVEAENAD